MPARLYGVLWVSTHSHPKVAAKPVTFSRENARSFNTQPPEGGCTGLGALDGCYPVFQHTATRRWLREYVEQLTQERLFQHTATRRWLQLNINQIAELVGFNTQPPEGGCTISKRLW